MKNVKDGIVYLKNKPFTILIGLTESLMFSMLHIFIFVWTPVMKELNPNVNTSEVFTLFMMSLMVGAACFRV